MRRPVIALVPLPCSYLAVTSEADVARVESKTYICLDNERDAHPIPKAGVKAITANWRDPQEMRREIAENFNGCMQGEEWVTEGMALTCVISLCVQRQLRSLLLRDFEPKLTLTAHCVYWLCVTFAPCIIRVVCIECRHYQ